MQLQADQKKEVRITFWISVAVSLILAAIIWILGPRLVRLFEHLPDQGSRWYFWKLPKATVWGRITAWSGYALHQLSIWFIIIKARQEKPHANRISKLNLWALGINFVFIIAHLVQSHVWYDGLAQDVPIWTSQFSVIIMLVLILFLTMSRRGLFFGKKIKVPEKTLKFVQKYHGYYIAWALIYTFWFHPMESTYAILIGFIYMFFLFIQMSMFNTRLHFNMSWIVFLEVFVGFHGPLVAIMNKQDAWPMFLFGFFFLFVATQMHGLKLKLWAKFSILGIYIGGLIAAYSFRGFGQIYEIAFIPAGLYGGAFALLLIAWIIKALTKSKGETL